MAYLYRHIRLDKNEPFYVGIGSEESYGRAYDKSERNQYWKNITSTSEYRVDIVFENLTWEEACKKEIEFISLYGRRDLGTGILCNFTDGGEGAYGRQVTQETRDKISKSVKKNSYWKNGRKHTPETIEKIIKAMVIPVIDITSGTIYESIKEAAFSLGIRPNTLTRKLSGIRTNNTNLKYYIQ